MNLMEREELKRKRTKLCEDLNLANFATGVAIFDNRGPEAVAAASKHVDNLAQQLRELDAQLTAD